MELKKELVEIYQLHIWLKHSSPMVWRSLLVRSDASIADLHHYIQIAMGWEDEHLHQFMIRQGSHGIYHPGGMFFDEDPDKTLLKDFDFYINEKFKYEYNFHVPWEHEIRVEKKLSFDPKKKYPLCIGGKNTGPSGVSSRNGMQSTLRGSGAYSGQSGNGSFRFINKSFER